MSDDMRDFFRRASGSHPDAEDPVEVDLRGPVFIAMRAGNSPDHELLFLRQEWLDFIASVKAGEFDLSPALCAFCQGRRAVGLVWSDGMDITGPMGCPHCAGLQPIEIRIYPLRNDQTRGETA